MNNSDLQFVTKTSGGQHTQNDIDVSVTLVGNRTGAAFSFSRKAVAKMGDKDYLVAARKGVRIYLMPAVEQQGFKLTRKTDCGRKMVRFPAAPLGMTSENWVGYYGLQWDRERELFYINIDLRQG